MRRIIVSLVTAILLGTAQMAAAQPARGLQSSLNRSLSRAGNATGALVIDLNTGQTLYSLRPGSARLPASVEKLYTTATALSAFGPNGTLQTTVRGVGSVDGRGTWRGTLYLRGGGDPTFGSASYVHFAYGSGATMQRLIANLIRATGIRSLRGAIVGDESVFDPLRGTSATGYGFSPDLEGELSGLAYDRGFADEQGATVQNRPPVFAAQRFAVALRAAGVTIPRGTRVSAGAAPRSSRLLGAVNSPRMATLIRLTNTPSDNFLAEMLLKDVGSRLGGRGSSATGAAMVRRQLSTLGLHPRLVDGSGLSRADLTSPRDVVTLLSALAANQPFVSSLAVAGQTGTIRSGLRGTTAQGRCRGKTGTLHDVANLVGYCTGANQHTLAFAFLMNGVNPSAGHALEYQMAVALARYAG